LAALPHSSAHALGMHEVHILPSRVTLSRIVAFLLQPMLRAVLRFTAPEDPWERIEGPVRLGLYGSGSRHDFAWYFEGPSSVTVNSVNEIQDWLLGCSYKRDPDLFNEPDFWQHPRTFEELRKGDCEDYAVWAWRKLVELGYDADLVTGHVLPITPAVSGHAWVVFRTDGIEYVLDPVVRTKARMVRPLADVRNEYRPEFGVDRNKRRFAYGGFLLTLRERSNARRTA